MTIATWNMIRRLVHLLSVAAATPATPSAKIAPITRAVKGVKVHGQMAIAAAGNRNRKMLVTAAATPSAAMILAVPGDSSKSPAVAVDRSRWLISHTARTRNGVLKYRTAHNGNAMLAWMNRPQ